MPFCMVISKIPPGHPQSGNPNLLCKLNRLIYGLKKSPRAWHSKFTSILEELGFFRSDADSSLFIHNSKGEKLVVLVYVDDMCYRQ